VSSFQAQPEVPDEAAVAAESTVDDTATSALDLDLIERDLADVEAALGRLDSGQYWLDEVTGQPLDDELLAQSPTARRAAGA
jgi:hypothetical protein